MSASPSFPKLPKNWSETSLWLDDGNLHLRLYFKTEATLGRLLFIVHGQAEQSDRYEHFAHFLTDTIDVIAAIDLPGHGKSKGTRGHIQSFEDYHEACLLAFARAQTWTAEKFGKCQAQWFGHSLGGLISLGIALRHPELKLKSFAISAPLLDVAFPIPVIKSKLAILTEPLLGKIPMNNELNVKNVSRDPEVVKEYSANKLNHKYLTSRFFVRLMSEMKSVRENTTPIQHNLSMYIPLADKIVSQIEGRRFFANCKLIDGKIKQLEMLPGYYHESFNDIGKERAFLALETWLKKFY